VLEVVQLFTRDVSCSEDTMVRHVHDEIHGRVAKRQYTYPRPQYGAGKC
jgi:hypothetical protein